MRGYALRSLTRRYFFWQKIMKQRRGWKENQCGRLHIRDQVIAGPVHLRQPLREKPRRIPFIVPPGDDLLVDSIEKSIFVPAGEEYCVRFDYRLSRLIETSVPYDLTNTAQEAIAIAPTWLQRDLEDKFRQLDESHQDELANLLLNLDDPRIIDEVAFQIAHISRTIITNGYFEPELMKINADLMYVIDEDLQFVEIVDYDLGNGNFYSTTNYEILVGGVPTTIELPYEIYYWWIVMPKVSDEIPLI